MKQSNSDTSLTDHLLERVVSMCPFEQDVITKWQYSSSPDIFNGQIVLSAPRPSGGVLLLLGEFVNHGLPAAVGAISTAEVFYGMVAKGLCTIDIVEELNKKLLFLLPDGMFLSACIIGLDNEGKLLDVWNGGMPDMIVLDEEKNVKHRVVSSKSVIGAKPEIDAHPVFIQVDAGDCGYIYSELDLQAKAMWFSSYSNNALEDFLINDDIESITSAFLEKQQHDFTLVSFAINQLNQLDSNFDFSQPQKQLPASDWQVRFDFQAEALRNVDIVPIIINTVMQIQAPHEHRQRIYTVITELCSNALDHGILGLKSELKQSPNGFAEYYMQRTDRLATLEQGYIKVCLTHEALSPGGKLVVDIEDSGEGFDYKSSSNKQSDSKTFSGRGMSLLNQLCNKVEFLGKGNQVQVEYHWS